MRSRRFRSKERDLLRLTILSFGLAAYSPVHVRDQDPGPSVEEPATMMAVLFAPSSLQAFVSYLRQQPTGNTGRTS